MIFFLLAGLILILFWMCTLTEPSIPHMIEHLDTYNGRMSVDDQYFYDKLLEDVDYIPNKYVDDYALNDIEIRGIDKCQQTCPGLCVEFGITGHAYCFREDKPHAFSEVNPYVKLRDEAKLIATREAGLKI